MPARKTCPFLDTVNRSALEFDFEKKCSKLLVEQDVFGCLVCGRYFRGKREGTPAHTHSLESSHHVFISLETTAVWCLPDNYEVEDPSLDDVKYNLNPTYTKDQIVALPTTFSKGRALSGKEYVRGFLGFNNLGRTDWMNSTLQALSHIPEVMQHFMVLSPDPEKFPVSARFSEVLRKTWSIHTFRPTISPHEFAQAIMKATKGGREKFTLTEPTHPLTFLLWLSRCLKDPTSRQSILHGLFAGKILKRARIMKARGEGQEPEETGESSVGEVPFLCLTLPLPEMPLFKEESEKNLIPQIQLFSLLTRYNGIQENLKPSEKHGYVENSTQIVTELPDYMVLSYARFAPSNTEKLGVKNNCLINFPLKSLDMKEFATDEAAEGRTSTKYDLVANICHSGTSSDGSFHVHLLHGATAEWYMVQDLAIKVVQKEEVACTAPVLQVWKSQGERTTPARGGGPPAKKQKL